jgi:hypothetical protein
MEVLIGREFVTTVRADWLRAGHAVTIHALLTFAKEGCRRRSGGKGLS